MTGNVIHYTNNHKTSHIKHSHGRLDLFNLPYLLPVFWTVWGETGAPRINPRKLYTETSFKFKPGTSCNSEATVLNHIAIVPPLKCRFSKQVCSCKWQLVRSWLTNSRTLYLWPVDSLEIKPAHFLTTRKQPLLCVIAPKLFNTGQNRKMATSAIKFLLLNYCVFSQWSSVSIQQKAQVFHLFFILDYFYRIRGSDLEYL